MRSREQIEMEHQETDDMSSPAGLQLEVMLDIRDLLMALAPRSDQLDRILDQLVHNASVRNQSF